MRRQSSIQTKLHHQRLSIRQLNFAAPVEGLRHEQIFAQNPFDDLQVLVWIVGLAVGLLPRNLGRSVDAAMGKSELLLNRKDSLAAVQAFLLLLGALFKEHFAQDIFLFLVGVVVLDVVVVRLVEHAVRIVVAVRVFVSDSPGVRHARVRVHPHAHAWLSLVLIVLTCYQ